MQSNGGIISVDEARRSGVRCVLSGPAGGVMGAQAIARQSQSASRKPSQVDNTHPLKLITFDMGGTSTDVSLIDGIPQTTSEMAIGGCPIRLPVLDIHTIGAGGGSIASVDAGGALRVGPESAGAYPGPACYGRTDDGHPGPTVTDANLLLGRMSADHFLDGKMPLYPDRSLAAIAGLAHKIGATPQQAALGILAVVNAHMERALRLISVERGFDPRQFTLLSFGGAGGLHATQLASRLGIRRVLIPRYASTLSAFGMLTADVVKDYSLTVMVPGTTSYSHLQELFQPLVVMAQQEMSAEGFAKDEIELVYKLDSRYHGQSYELTIPFSHACVEDFHAAHHKTYGYQRLDTPVEIVNLRLQAKGSVEQPVLAPLPEKSGTDQALPEFYRQLWFQDGDLQIPFYLSANLSPGETVTGPAVVLCLDTTVYVESGWSLLLDFLGNFVLVNGYAHFLSSIGDTPG
jgi:N-methylhydantoinase A